MAFTGSFEKRIIVTGGAGFIGSNLLLYLVPGYRQYLFVNVDCLTYAGNLTNLASIENHFNYRFERIDIRDYDSLKGCFDQYDVNGLIHLAAESHVDRSIIGPAEFISSNINGTFNLLELARERANDFRFQHVSTDEVYGSLGPEGCFNESSPYNPSSPYAASKAAGDHMVKAYFNTYGLDAVISNCSNNYGPYQFPEKLIPLTIRNALDGIPIPVYRDGSNIRDWIYVEDHCHALDLVFHKGQPGETYNIGGEAERKNIEVVRQVCRLIDERMGEGQREELITFVEDRPGHDHRYSMDTSRVSSEFGWKPVYSFDQGLVKTVEWYLNNRKWLDDCISGEYLKYYETMYHNR